jgi:hypothetical protein
MDAHRGFIEPSYIRTVAAHSTLHFSSHGEESSGFMGRSVKIELASRSGGCGRDVEKMGGHLAGTGSRCCGGAGVWYSHCMGFI